MKTVLILTASEETEQFLRKALGSQYHILSGHTGNVGQLLLGKPDALVLELSLPGCTGLDILEENKKHLPPVVMALTVFLSSDVMEAAAQVGVTCMLRLPCTTREIASCLEKQAKKFPPVREGKDCQKDAPYEQKLT